MEKVKLNLESKVILKRLTPLKAIRAWCLNCSGFQPSEVRNCYIPECPLFSYRMGKNPNRSGIGRKFGFPNKKTSAETANSDKVNLKSAHGLLLYKDRKNSDEGGKNG